MRFLTYAKNFIEFRARAFVYACFALVGFILGVIVTYDLALALLAGAQ